MNESQFHLITFLISVYTVFYMPDSSYMTFHPSVTDLKYVRFISYSCVAVTAHGFMALVYCIFINKDFTRLGKQMILHHAILVIVGTLALVGGQAMPKLFLSSFICEITQPFFALREFKGKHEWKGPWSLLNNVTFFILFTFFRVLYFPLILVSHWECGYLFNFESQTGFQKFCYYFNMMSFIFMCLLQLVWYRIMVRGVIKLLRGDEWIPVEDASHLKKDQVEMPKYSELQEDDESGQVI